MVVTLAKNDAVADQEVAVARCGVEVDGSFGPRSAIHELAAHFIDKALVQLVILVAGGDDDFDRLGGGHTDDLEGLALPVCLFAQNLVGCLNAAARLRASLARSGFFIGHLGKKNLVRGDKAAHLIDMGRKTHAKDGGSVFLLVENAQSIIIVLKHGLRKPDNLVEVVNALVLGLYFLFRELGIALAAFRVLDGDQGAVTVKLAVAALGYHFGIHDIKATECNGHVNGCLACRLTLRGVLIPHAVVGPSGVDHIRMALVVDHDAGAVVADIEVGVFELRDLDTIEIDPLLLQTRAGFLVGARGAAVEIDRNVAILEQSLDYINAGLAVIETFSTNVIGKPCHIDVGALLELARHTIVLVHGWSFRRVSRDAVRPRQ